MKVRTVILAIAIAVVSAPVASARETTEQMQINLHRLQTKINYAERFAAQDRQDIRTKTLWMPSSPAAIRIVSGIDIFLKRQHLRVMQRIVAQTRPLYQKLHKRYLAALTPPHYRQWICIHGYEGSWKDAGAPYYGGLQMDLGFQRTYGPKLLRTKGTADHWTPLEQMWVAERAYKSRGFYPWPNTARYCGLI